MFGDGSQTRDYTYITDVVDMFVRAAAHRSVNGVFNVGTGRETSVNNIIETLRQVTGANIHVRCDPPRVGEVNRIALAPDRAARAFGWSAQVSLRAGIQATFAWLAEQQ